MELRSSSQGRASLAPTSNTASQRYRIDPIISGRRTSPGEFSGDTDVPIGERYEAGS